MPGWRRNSAKRSAPVSTFGVKTVKTVASASGDQPGGGWRKRW